MANAFDQFDQVQQGGNPFDQFDAPQKSLGLAGRIGQGWKQDMADFNNIGQNGESGIERAVLGVKTYANALARPINEAITSAGQAITDNTAPNAPYKVIGRGINDLYQGSDAQSAVKDAGQIYDNAAQQNPRLAAMSNAFLSMGGDVAALEGAAPIAGKVITGASQIAKDAGQSIIDSRLQNAAEKAVVPKLTAKQAINQGVPQRIQQGFFGSKIAPLPQEQAAADVLASLPGFKSGNTAVKNFQLVDSSLNSEADNLRQVLDSSGVQINPNDYRDGLINLKNQIQNTTGISEATRAARMSPIDTMLEITNGAATPTDLLNARQELDRTFFNDKGVLPASAKKVYKDAIAPVRDFTNQYIGQAVPSAAVTDSLAKQSALFTARDGLAPKAIKEAPTALGRAIQDVSEKIPIKDPRLKLAAETAGLAGIGAATYLAPAATAIGAGAYVGSKALPYALKAAGFTLDNAGKLLKAGTPLTARDIGLLSPALAVQVLKLNQGNQ